MPANGISRRDMIVRSAAAAAGLSLSISISAATRKAHALVDPKPDADKDNTTLNALLAAEYDAVATYTAGAGLIGADSGTPQATRDLVTAVAVHFQSQHKDHAAALKKLIEDNKGTAVDDSGMAKLPAKFPATGATTTDVIKLAADKEKQAAYTYAQVMETISTQTAAKLVASIGAVEAQHFVVLYLLAEGLIEATDKTMAMASLVVPASFVLDVGGDNTTNLEKFAALDDLLKLDAA
jgi:Ferritin-like domain